ncbi:Wzz/FepE/Etk N-terminal domain-containing protein [Paenibacillus hamazuiensis]|uniref:Wzz/FepE/Etk N-terminal domain-containing protein n=1 Tax=Paenibacillus hamazuiensis TaxID=2936508 RepID=UPI00200BD2CA|nr:Wzz/FepE/Etk N-terminal domain-containing protein [Paenibacillus hamazuiensis]
MQEEKKLKEIILVILDAKKLIILSTVLCMLLGVIISYSIKPTFEVSTNIMINNQDDKEQPVLKDLSPIGDYVKSKFVILKMIKELNLNYSAEYISSNLLVEVPKDANQIKLKVTGQDAGLITKMANYLADEVGAYLEISARLNMISSYQKRLIDAEDNLKVSNSELSEATKQLQGTQEKLLTEKSLSDDPYLQSVVAEATSGSNKKVGALQLRNEEINPLYTSLKTKVADLTIMVSRIQSDKQVIEERIASNQNKIDEIQKSIASNNNQSNDGLVNFVNKYSTVLITPAIEPVKPVTPKKIINTFLASLIGFVGGIFISLFRDYWKNSPVVERSQKNISL